MNEQTPLLPSEPHHGEESRKSPIDEFTFFDFVVIFFIYFISQFFLFGLATIFLSHPKGIMAKGLALSIGIFGALTIVVAYWFQGRHRYRFSWEKMGWILPSFRQILIWGLLFFISVSFFNWFYLFLLRWFHLSEPKQRIVSFLRPDFPLWLQALGFLVVVIFAPLSEEILYRNVLAKALEKRFGLHLAALFSAFLFAAAHFELKSLVPLAFLGYVLALIFLRTRSLPLSIIIHSLNNLFALAMLHILFILERLASLTHNFNLYFF